MFTNEMKNELLNLKKENENACLSVYVDEEFDSSFYSLEYLMHFVVNGGFVIADFEKSSIFSNEISVDVSKPRTTEELLDFGLSFKEVNKYLKEQEDSIECQREFLEDLQDDFQAYNEKTPEMSKMISAIIEGIEKSAEWEKKAKSPEPKKTVGEPAGCGGLALVKKPFILRPMTEKEKDEIDKLFGISGLNLAAKEVK